MKNPILAVFVMMAGQSAMAGDLVIMKSSGKQFNPVKREKLIMISASNVNGSETEPALVTAASASMYCSIKTANIAAAAAIVAAVDENTDLECFTREEIGQFEGRDRVMTSEINIAKILGSKSQGSIK